MTPAKDTAQTENAGVSRRFAFVAMASANQ